MARGQKNSMILEIDDTQRCKVSPDRRCAQRGIPTGLLANLGKQSGSDPSAAAKVGKTLRQCMHVVQGSKQSCASQR